MPVTAENEAAETGRHSIYILKFAPAGARGFQGYRALSLTRSGAGFFLA